MSEVEPLRILGDDTKRKANLAKHGLDIAEVTPVIFDSGIVQIAKDGRCEAIGFVAGRLVTMIFKPLGSEAIAVISLRPASKKERKLL